MITCFTWFTIWESVPLSGCWLEELLLKSSQSSEPVCLCSSYVTALSGSRKSCSLLLHLKLSPESPFLSLKNSSQHCSADRNLKRGLCNSSELEVSGRVSAWTLHVESLKASHGVWFHPSNSKYNPRGEIRVCIKEFDTFQTSVCRQHLCQPAAPSRLKAKNTQKLRVQIA